MDTTIEITDELTITPSGQYLLRFRHLESQDFQKGDTANFFRHRARLGVEGMYAGRFGAFVQVQDVRIYGEERHTLFDFSGDGLDMHQAYLRVFPIEPLEIKLGRQEIAYLNQRLIGAVGWLEQARSFDALHATFQPDKMLSIDMFYASVGEDNSSTTADDGMPFHTDDKDLIAANIHLTPTPAVSPAVLFMTDLDGVPNSKRHTLGGIVTGKLDVGFSYSAEGYYQFGNADPDIDYRAWMLGLAANMEIDVCTKPFFGAFADLLSGDDDLTDGTVETFATPFATNHKFYGEMDFFLNTVAHTEQRGLADVGGTAGFKPFKGGVAKITFHHFRAMANRGDLKVFGNEVDFKMGYSPWKPLKLDLMYGVFAPGSIKKCFADDTGSCTNPNTKSEHFLYSTASASF